MNHNDISLTILVKNRPITEYRHHGQIFVEGRASSEYEIEVRNASADRVEAVISVDGLSVIDGKNAGAQSKGYLIEPRNVVRIPGWTLDNQQVAKFAFSGKQESYATQMTGESHNNGVIGVMAFREKHWALAYQASQLGAAAHGRYGNPYMPPRGIASKSYNMVSRSSVASTAEVKTSGGLYSGVPLSIVDQSVGNSLGTAFGNAQDFSTTTVQFHRGDMLAMMVLYYDDLKGLLARGVPIERVKKGKYKTRPDAFPAMAEGCVPPPGWHG